jgi:hypothetical protein
MSEWALLWLWLRRGGGAVPKGDSVGAAVGGITTGNVPITVCVISCKKLIARSFTVISS